MTKTITTLTSAATLALALLLAGPATAAPTDDAASVDSDGVDSDGVDSLDNLEQDQDRFDAAVELEGQININTASAAELELLPRIGPSIAQRIVDYRSEHPFKELNHLMRVKGVGKKTYLEVKPFIAIEGESTLRVKG